MQSMLISEISALQSCQKILHEDLPNSFLSPKPSTSPGRPESLPPPRQKNQAFVASQTKAQFSFLRGTPLWLTLKPANPETQQQRTLSCAPCAARVICGFGSTAATYFVVRPVCPLAKIQNRLRLVAREPRQRSQQREGRRQHASADVPGALAPLPHVEAPAVREPPPAPLDLVRRESFVPHR